MLEIMPKRIHFIGIGGTGMSGLAKILLLEGYRVTGSDLVSRPVTRALESLGGVCYIGHKEENIGDAELVVVSSAIGLNNPEVIQAKKKGIPVIHRVDLLAWLMQKKKGIAIAGAHGKTTTTSMLALALEKNGLDPTIIVGGELNDIGGNAKLGRGEYIVAESDESDGSFLKLKPLAAIITNIEDDHLDYYGSVENIKAAFKAFLAGLPANGKAVVCLDDANVRGVISGLNKTLITYALNHQADYNLKKIRLNGQRSSGKVYFRDKYLGDLELPVPGLHNLSNALGVMAMGLWLGLELEQISGALKEFQGVRRRFQFIGEVQGAKIFDDYAHHPTEIMATLQAARNLKPKRLVAVFQPHRYTRTALLKERFGTAFKDADLIIVTEIYGAGETPIKGVTAQLIIDTIKKHKQVIYLPTTEEVVNYLLENIRPGDLILTMGAGNIWKVGIKLVKGETTYAGWRNLPEN